MNTLTILLSDCPRIRNVINLILYGYGRLYSLIFFSRYINLIGKAHTKINPSTFMDMRNSKIVVENGTAKIGYLTGWGVKNYCRFRMVNSRLHIIGDVSLRPGLSVWAMNSTIVIRNGTVINGPGDIISGLRVEIGEHCQIAQSITILDSDLHKHATGDNKPVNVFKEVIIGNHCWIGANVMILKGVRIGNGAIVAAGSIVTKDVEERTLVGGIPARKIRDRVVWEA